MGAFAVIYDRSNTPVQPDVLERVMRRMEHRGPDGYHAWEAGNIAIGHWQFWTTPEEIGEKQPHSLPGKPFKIVLDGRIDNRADLISELKIDIERDRCLSDSDLILYAYDRWGEYCFEHFLGEYAVTIFDEQRDELICARDALGDRTLFYTRSLNCFLVASEPWALAGANGSSFELDDVGAAYFFAMRTPEDGRTLFKDIYELLPAQALVVSRSGERFRQYWQPDFSARIRYRSDTEYAEHFLSLLKTSVRCRMRSTTPIGVMMSGGLDSTSIACLAARILAPHPLTTISYVFDELTDCDERAYIEAVKTQWNLHSIQIPCDDAWPFKDFPLWLQNKNYPPENPFRLLKERVFQLARQEGLRVLLTGSFADHMFMEETGWLADLLNERQLLDALKELLNRIQMIGLRRSWEEGFMQQAGKSLLGIFPGRSFTRPRNQGVPAWMTPQYSQYFRKTKNEFSSTLGKTISMLSLRNAQGSSSERFYASRWSVDQRHPFRDRRLIEFALAIPAYQFYRHGSHKHILRTAMQNILPEVIRTRSKPTALTPLFFRGMEQERDTLTACIQDPHAAWRKFVRPDWLAKLAPGQKGPMALIPWLCTSYEMWYKSLIS